MEERVAPTLQDDLTRNGSGMVRSVRVGRPEGREAVYKGRQPNPGLPVKRLHVRSAVDDGVAPRFESPSSHCVSPPKRRSHACGKRFPQTFTKVRENNKDIKVNDVDTAQSTEFQSDVLPTGNAPPSDFQSVIFSR